VDGRDAPGILRRAMTTSSITSATIAREMLSLASAQTAMAQTSASSDGAVGVLLQAKQLDAVRAQMRDGESFSVSA
jgi:hypothetical protein